MLPNYQQPIRSSFCGRCSRCPTPKNSPYGNAEANDKRDSATTIGDLEANIFECRRLRKRDHPDHRPPDRRRFFRFAIANHDIVELKIAIWRCRLRSQLTNSMLKLSSMRVGKWSVTLAHVRGAPSPSPSSSALSPSAIELWRQRKLF